MKGFLTNKEIDGILLDFLIMGLGLLGIRKTWTKLVLNFCLLLLALVKWAYHEEHNSNHLHLATQQIHQFKGKLKKVEVG